MKTIGEFVENKEIDEKLKELGVDHAQGYYIAKPKENI
jgi:EAL domain-containing protein (putative c-di-GMP-specific phosphodiesterase class I)